MANTWRSEGKAPGGSVDLASLAAGDLLDPFNLLMYSSSAWICGYVVTAATAFPQWNGVSVTHATPDGGLWTCREEIGGFPQPIAGLDPFTLVSVKGPVTTGDYFTTSYAAPNTTIDWNVAAGTAVTNTTNPVFQFRVLTFRPRRGLGSSLQTAALEGGLSGVFGT